MHWTYRFRCLVQLCISFFLRRVNHIWIGTDFIWLCLYNQNKRIDSLILKTSLILQTFDKYPQTFQTSLNFQNSHSKLIWTFLFSAQHRPWSQEYHKRILIINDVKRIDFFTILFSILLFQLHSISLFIFYLVYYFLHIIIEVKTFWTHINKSPFSIFITKQITTKRREKKKYPKTYSFSMRRCYLSLISHFCLLAKMKKEKKTVSYG